MLVVAILLLAGLATAQPRFITTTFASNNGGSTTWVNMFDVKVLDPNGLKITDLDVNISSAVNTPFTITVYTTPTTYVGNDGNPAVWTSLSTGNGLGAGRDLPSPVDVTDFVLKQGSWGVGIHYVGASMAYTNGTGSNQTYKNSDIELQLGLVRAGFFTGTVFTPRVWNGTIYYDSAVTASLTGSGTRKPGSTYTYFPTSPNEPTLPYQMGSSVGNGPIPIDSRQLYLSVDALLVLSTGGVLPSVFKDYSGFLDNSGKATASLEIPNIPALTGVDIYTAFVTLKASAPSGVSAISNTAGFQIQ
jgi:hypothetical protein